MLNREMVRGIKKSNVCNLSRYVNTDKVSSIISELVKREDLFTVEIYGKKLDILPYIWCSLHGIEYLEGEYSVEDFTLTENGTISSYIYSAFNTLVRKDKGVAESIIDGTIGKKITESEYYLKTRQLGCYDNREYSLLRFELAITMGLIYDMKHNNKYSEIECLLVKLLMSLGTIRCLYTNEEMFDKINEFEEGYKIKGGRAIKYTKISILLVMKWLSSLDNFDSIDVIKIASKRDFKFNLDVVDEEIENELDSYSYTKMIVTDSEIIRAMYNDKNWIMPREIYEAVGYFSTAIGAVGKCKDYINAYNCEEGWLKEIEELKAELRLNKNTNKKLSLELEKSNATIDKLNNKIEVIKLESSDNKKNQEIELLNKRILELENSLSSVSEETVLKNKEISNLKTRCKKSDALVSNFEKELIEKDKRLLLFENEGIEIDTDINLSVIIPHLDTTRMCIVGGTEEVSNNLKRLGVTNFKHYAVDKKLNGIEPNFDVLIVVANVAKHSYVEAFKNKCRANKREIIYFEGTNAELLCRAVYSRINK